MIRRRGVTLVEMLVSLVVIGGLMAALAGVFGQTMHLSSAQDRTQDRQSAQDVTFGFLEARLQGIALVGQPGRPRQPMFSVARREVQFVTRLLPPAPNPGLHLLTIRGGGQGVRVVLTDWPAQRQRVETRLPGTDIFFEPEGQGSIVPGLPLALTVTLDGETRRLSLGAQLPLDCVLPLGDREGLGGPVQCPGVTN